MSERAKHRSRKRFGVSLFILTMTIALLLGLYPHLRYAGRTYGGGDTARFTRWISAMQSEMALVPQSSVYGNGYGFQSLAVFADVVSGLDVAVFQSVLGTLLITWTMLMAWLFYREISNSNLVATLASFILLVQPEFLFVILRGTHEKFTRGLMFLALYLLVRSISSSEKSRRFAAFVIAFYLVIYALITFNNLMSVSFIIALGLTLILSLTITRISTPQNENLLPTQRRLLYAVGISLILAFVYTFYAYPPARSALFVFESVADRVAVMLLDVEEAANPYGVVTSGWTSVYVYFFVSAANWLLLIASFAIWSGQTVLWWRTKTWPQDTRTILLWSMFGAFGLLGAISIIVDFSGAIAANLQHRMFPSFVMIAAPLVAIWFIERQRSRPASRLLAFGLLSVLIGVLGVLAVSKSTNEPSLSNRWVYYAPSELRALSWWTISYPERHIWASFDERLLAAVTVCCSDEFDPGQLDVFQPEPATRSFLISEVTRARSQRMNLPLPIEGDSLRIYDNGESEIYRLRPRTPFQK